MRFLAVPPLLNGIRAVGDCYMRRVFLWLKSNGLLLALRYWDALLVLANLVILVGTLIVNDEAAFVVVLLTTFGTFG